ncbi:MAG: hypothetical protein QNI90_10730 [Dinoroseobacter sp.]|nr:hypothetical protein [Dinoroseobacter sp.]
MFHSAGKLLCSFLLGIAVSMGVAGAEQSIDEISLQDMRGMRYCEFVLVFEDRLMIYNTTNSAAGCPGELWDKLDTNALAEEHGAKAVQLNGPKFWATDAQTLGFGGTKTFGGIEAGYAATLPMSALGSGEGADPYVPFTTKKDQTLVYKAGQPVYEVVDPDGRAYVLNAFSSVVKDGDPANLADQLTPGDGWTFRVRVPEEDLVIVHTSEVPKKMVGDDLRNYYSSEFDD